MQIGSCSRRLTYSVTGNTAVAGFPEEPDRAGSEELAKVLKIAAVKGFVE